MDQQERPSTEELLEACSVLFGGNVMCSVGFLRCIRAEGIKSAYRRRLLESHPDRAQIVGEAPDELHDRTLAVQSAYSLLADALQDGQLDVPEEQVHIPPPPPTPEGLFYTGPVPQRPLRLGEFLYYRGLISWETLIQAICSQRRDRPVLGELAVQFDFLTREESQRVHQCQEPGEKFGEAAVRLGLLSPGRVYVLLGTQRRMSKLFGEYIAESGALSLHQLARLIDEHRQHNRRCPR